MAHHHKGKARVTSDASRSELIEKQARRLVDGYELTRVEIAVTNRNVHARAYPLAMNPIIEEKRANFLEGKVTITLGELSEIDRSLLDTPIARSTGPTIESALMKLETDLAVEKAARRAKVNEHA
jgi:hypothetical protein